MIDRISERLGTPRPVQVASSGGNRGNCGVANLRFRDIVCALWHSGSSDGRAIVTLIGNGCSNSTTAGDQGSLADGLAADLVVIDFLESVS